MDHCYDTTVLLKSLDTTLNLKCKHVKKRDLKVVSSNVRRSWKGLNTGFPGFKLICSSKLVQGEIAENEVLTVYQIQTLEICRHEC
jgi:hypothetical protein